MAEVNQELSWFTEDFQNAVNLYVQSLTGNPVPTSGTTTTTAPTDNSGAVLLNDIPTRANLMTQHLVAYFNALPVKLPRTVGTPGFSGNRTAIQQFLKATISGTGANSLTQALLAMPLPTVVGPDVTLYNGTAQNIIDTTHSKMISGMKSMFQNPQPGAVAPA